MKYRRFSQEVHRAEWKQESWLVVGEKQSGGVWAPFMCEFYGQQHPSTRLWGGVILTMLERSYKTGHRTGLPKSQAF